MTHLSDGRLALFQALLVSSQAATLERAEQMALVETVRVQSEALRAADAMRERIRKEDGGADDWGRWFECASYDDARAAVGVSGEPTP